MKKRIQLSIYFVFMICSFVNAQEYGNEWINYSQKYYKLLTAEEGFYRLTYSELQSVGFPVSTIDPRKIKIFHRGIEQSILVDGQNDASFDPGDYIEFYGTKNDGTLDEELYITPEAQPHKYYNLYSDTTAYFLTWSLSTNGKRMEEKQPRVNVDNLPPEAYHLSQIIDLKTNQYSAGLAYPFGVPGAPSNLAAFDYGEGWTGPRFGENQFKDIIFNGLDNIVTTGPRPIIEILLAGRNNLTHNISLEIGPDQGNLRQFQDITFGQHNNYLISDSIEWSDIVNGNLICRIRVKDNGDPNASDFVSISYVRLQFPEQLDQNFNDQKVFAINPTSDMDTSAYVEIKNVQLGAKMFDITDPYNIDALRYNISNGFINTVISNNNNGRRLLVSTKSLQVPKIEPVVMRNINPSQADFLIISHKSLRKASANYPDVPKAYASYRASSVGGRFDTLLINVDQLYNMFSYGEYTPVAVYRFCKWIADQGNPRYLFIMGKGLTGPYLYSFRNNNSGAESRDLVPTAGYPGTDILFTAGLLGTNYETGFPVGRISAETANGLETYFEKVKEMEATAHDALWRKEVVHLSGGSDLFQQNIFRRYVDGFKAIAEGERLGGKVFTIGKEGNSAPSQFSIAEYINAGKMLVTFFGHSATGSTDIDIGYVSNPSFGYINKGKYPMMIVNGCLAGDMYNTGFGFGEDWILTPDKGAIGFIAHTDEGLSSLLKRYTDTFYEVAFTDSIYIDKGIGDILKETGRRYLSRYSNSEMDISQVQQMALQGDPSITLFGVKIPDYEINADNVFAQSIDGAPINAFTEEFNLNLIVSNFGSTDRDSLKITIKRRLSNGNEIVLDTLCYKPVYYQDTLQFKVQSVGLNGFGLNQFYITLDPLNEIDELSETNNQAIFEYFIPLGGTQNINPANYSITNKQQIKLVAQSLDLLMTNRTYLFELDTTAAFTSPYRRQASFQGNSLVRWSVNLFDNLPETDTIVFYWRTKFSNPRDEELDIWHTTSFTYINNGSPGWAMAHFQQFDGNEMKNIVLNDQARSWEFEKFETSLKVKTFGELPPGFGYENVELIVNNTPYIFPTRLCTDNSMNLLAFDKSTTAPYLVLGSVSVLVRTSCGRIPQSINNFLKNEIESNLWIEQYIDQMGDGDYVLLFSIGNVTYQSWPATTIAKLEEIGVDLADFQGITDGEPLIILGKKGDPPGSAKVIRADYSSPTPPEEQEIFLEDVIYGQAENGTIKSPLIGPASNWVSFHQTTAYSESPVTDNYTFDIYGINNFNNETPLFNNIQLRDVDIQTVNANTYPFLRLELNVDDDTNLTPAQLKNWFVIFDGVPEGVLIFKEGQETTGIEKNEGEIHEILFSFENISDLSFQDSVAVEYRIFNQENRKSYIDTLKVKPLTVEEVVDFTLSLETLEKGGKNDLKVFANPYLQLEQNYNNNYINFQDYLTVIEDNSNPILEVTVDGEFIMDGDIVSPSPMIVLRMKDENTTLLKEDTLGINLYLNEQCSNCQPKRISFSSPDVIWTPATSESDFMVEYQPQSLADGIYTLRAEAADASGNPSGTEPYEVNFEIINESQITNFFPYPNPFSSRTQFVFTLTGSEIPEEIIIQIMTVNGTVVREITQDEIGPIKIGHNKTQYAWDGRDEYGDQLANGVYLYKVKIFTNGKEMKHRNTSADKAFKHGIGKMYLLR